MFISVLGFEICRKPLNCELEDMASVTVTQQFKTIFVAADHHIMEIEGRMTEKSCLHQQTTPVCLTATKTIITTINGTQATPEPHSTTPRYTLWRKRTAGAIITNKAQ